MSSKSAAAILQRQFKELTDPKKKIPSIRIELDGDNIFLWNIGIVVLNKGSLYNGGYLRGQIRFPNDFPFSPPTFRFTPAIYHPNVYKDGRLCISILHQSGDPSSDEPECETWTPVQSVESLLISIISLLEDPNPSSPANIDASIAFRKDFDSYKKKVLEDVEKSKANIPADFVIPESEMYAYSNGISNNKDSGCVDENFWYDSEEEESFDEESLMDDMEEDEEEDDDIEIAGKH